MPIYEYRCEDCDKVFEVIQKISEKSLLNVSVVKMVLFNEWYRLLVLDSKVLAGMRLISKQKNLIQKKRKIKYEKRSSLWSH